MQKCQLPPRSGIGFKPEHFAAIVEAPQPIGFFEVHAENYMGAGGPPHAQLRRLRENYSLSVHGVGLSIGGCEILDTEHLSRVQTLCDRYQPESFSEHLAWVSHNDVFFNDLLPLPYTRETLNHVIAHVDQVQSTLKRQILIENPSSYLLFAESTIPEPQFLDELARRTGCGLLLDITNVFIAATNHHSNPRAYLADFPLAHVREIHLSGHIVEETASDTNGRDDSKVSLLVDAHARSVADPVFDLYAETIARTGPVPSLIEWDNDVPAWSILRREAERVDTFLSKAIRQQAA
ncbi:DUF692 domain-containing protein [Beijerinckia indica]|uniref:Uncharacterized protein n=1 Tax=Beijerinckia indica subsp. indica (strain ATCC 9039 / DSM 1715 / NCIMB 8712) TaxID=395963 RepID=B2IC94_BEII9|nr:DUF692 domain-containing protein [Beijerinckia indica]ACB96691.1 protein of unknown function DUF692 [Beijerinckia indica subsp. indica ATCC 9039]